MLKEIVMVFVTAVIATFITLYFSGANQTTDQTTDQATLEQLSARIENLSSATPDNPPIVLSFTEELGQDAWLRGTNRGGEPRPGPADDAKPLTDSANSICYLTKVEFTSLGGAEDTTTCKISVDDFTGWWQVNAIQGDGTDASVSCNARCLVWE
jgi:hypothetical protein